MTEKPAGFFVGTEMPNTGWWEALWPDPADVLRKAGIKPDMDVIDLCCGDGWFTLPIAKMARQVIAIDIDPALIETTRLRLSENGVRNYHLAAGDAYDIARLWPQPVDFVFLANAFHGVPDQPRLAASVHDALKPSGHFAIVNWHRRSREQTPVLGEPRGPKTELRMSPDRTIAAVIPSGFTLTAVTDVSPYHYAAVFQRT